MELSADILQRMMPPCPLTLATKMVGPLNAAMKRGEINTRLRVAAFIAQIGHESLDLAFMKEIASGAAYEGRLDLGNTQPGDGKKFKGRGPIQVTGRDNYTKFAAWAKIDCVNHPELLEDPAIGFLASVWFWTTRGLNALADKENFLGISLRINGKRSDGFPNGWHDRQARYATARRVLS
jgi:putative chitinase